MLFYIPTSYLQSYISSIHTDMNETDCILLFIYVFIHYSIVSVFHVYLLIITTEIKRDDDIELNKTYSLIYKGLFMILVSLYFFIKHF
jgi:hypothetical protein